MKKYLPITLALAALAAAGATPALAQVANYNARSAEHYSSRYSLRSDADSMRWYPGQCETAACLDE